MKRYVFLLCSALVLFGSNAASARPCGNNCTQWSYRSGAYAQTFRIVSMSWGASYRLNSNFYHQFAINYERYYSGCLYRSHKGYGVNLVLFTNNNFSVGMKHYRAIRKYAGHELIPYWGISPSYFRISGKAGVNLKPLLGFKFSPFYAGLLGLDLDVTYGYEIPVVNESAFTAGRHDFSATLSLNVDIDDFLMLFVKEENRVDAKF